VVEQKKKKKNHIRELPSKTVETPHKEVERPHKGGGETSQRNATLTVTSGGKTS
jgi:hypothetical protein